MKYTILFASIIIASGVLFANLYNSVVDIKSWSADIPQSIDTARQYYKTVNPGDFYRIVGPILQILSLLSIIAFWKEFPGIRLYLIASFIFYVLDTVLTLAYFYPRNEIIFNTAKLTDIDVLKSALNQWNNMNWLRSIFIFAGVFLSCLALHKTYVIHSEAKKQTF